MNNRKVPVLFLIFRREDIAKASFESIREYKPTQLYIAGDGPRSHKPEEKELCEITRKLVLEMIDWDCEVHTLFREENLGCAKAVSKGISWFFEKEEYGIIVEDDCILSLDFFKLSEELLPKYQFSDSIMQVCAFNSAGSSISSNEYVFSKNAFIWGWATWRRAWKKMDMKMESWPKYSVLSLMKEYGFIQGCFRYYYWSKTYNNINTNQSWATRWNFSVLSNNGLCISPKANLSVNTGIGSDGGTHYTSISEDPYKNLKNGSVIWPLAHPFSIVANRIKISEESKDFRRLRYIGLKQIIRKIIKKK